jgi:YD repeat-containing protein
MYVLTGTPIVVGSDSFTVWGAGSTTTGTQAYTITINSDPTITPTTLPNWTAGSPYSQTISDIGGTPSETYSLVAGTMPPGLGVWPSTGLLNGTPTTTGIYSFTLDSVDAARVTATQGYVVTINPEPTLTPAVLPNWTVSRSYSQTISDIGGTPAETYSLASGALPTNLTLHPGTGVLSGTPSASGVYSFTLSSIDAADATATQSYNVTINPWPTITPAVLPNWTVSRSYSQTISDIGGTPSESYGVLSGTVPTGLSLNASTGILSGTPTATGVYSFTLSSIDAAGASASQGYTVTINPWPTITPTILPAGTLSLSYSQTISDIGGTNPETYALASGLLPPGVALTASTGILSGTPTTTGTYTFTITSTDAAGATASQEYTVPVGLPAVDASTGDGLGNDKYNTFQVPIGEAMVFPGTGAVSVAQPLDFDLSSGTNVGDPSLVYDSGAVDVRPLIQIQLATNPAYGVPTAIALDLIWNGTNEGTTFTPSGGTAGATYLLAVQGPHGTASGEYPWDVSVTVDYTSLTQTFVPSGQTPVVAEDNSPFGAGWGLSGVDHLLLTDGGVLWMTGSGAGQFYTESASTTSTTTFANPYDFGTLVETGTGSTATFEYTAPDGNQTHFLETNSSTLLFEQASVVDPHGLTTADDYNSSDELTQVVAADGVTTTLGYSGGDLTTIVEPGTHSLSLQYDGSNDLTLLTDEDGNTRTFSYDGNHHLTQDQWSPYHTTFGYASSDGLLTEVNQGAGITWGVTAQAGQGLQTSPALYAADDDAVISDGAGDATLYEINSVGEETFQQAPDGGTQTWGVNVNGLTTLYLDDNGLSTAYQYSGGSLAGEEDPDGNATSYQYNILQEVTEEIDVPAGGREATTTSFYDSAGDLTTQITDPGTGAAATTVNAYTSTGLLTLSTDPDGNETTYSYDSHFQLTFMEEYDSGSNEVNHASYTYDSNGNPVDTITADGTTVDSYDKRNQLTAEVVYDANGVTVASSSSTGYLASGLVSQTLDGDGNKTTSTYNSAGLATVQEMLDSGSNVISSTGFAYNAAGEVSTQTDGDGNVTTYGYDGDGNFTAQIMTDASSVTVYKSYSYLNFRSFF